MGDGFVDCGRWIFEQFIEYHEGRRAPLSSLAVEEEPAVILWQAAVKVDEIIDDDRCRPFHVGRGKALVAEPGSARQFAFRRPALNRFIKRILDVFFIITAHRQGLDNVSKGPLQAGRFVLFDFCCGKAAIRRILRAMPAHGRMIEKAVGFLPQVNIPDRHIGRDAEKCVQMGEDFFCRLPAARNFKICIAAEMNRLVTADGRVEPPGSFLRNCSRSDGWCIY